MSDVEGRLRDAATEVREVASRSPVRPLPQKSPAARGWLAFATAFAAVVVVFGLIPALTSPDLQQPGATQTPTTELATPTTTIPQTSTTPELDSCSVDGLELPEAGDTLPPAVADRFESIVEAASSCDVIQLREAAAEDFVASFGGDGAESILLWGGEESGRLFTLITVLGTSHAVVETGDEGTIYVWPAAFAHDTWVEIPEDQIEELLALYTREELNQIAQFGAYAGWRVGIDENGNWLFFVAGD